MRAILFDLDDTLYRFAPCHAAALDAAYRVLGGPLDLTRAAFEARYDAVRDAWVARLGEVAAAHSREIFFKTLVEEARGRTTPTLSLDANSAYWDGFLSAMAPEPGVRDLLEDLGRRGLGRVLVTNLTVGIQLTKLVRLGLDHCFEQVVTSEEAGADKPDPRPFQVALARSGVDPGDALMVGDDFARDVLGATAVGLPACWIRWGRPVRPLPPGCSSVARTPELAQVLELARPRPGKGPPGRTEGGP